jgi:hypothetical protein
MRLAFDLREAERVQRAHQPHAWQVFR